MNRRVLVAALLLLAGCVTPAAAPRPAAETGPFHAWIEVTVDELDPIRPEGVVRVVVENRQSTPILVPAEYDGRRVRLCASGPGHHALIRRELAEVSLVELAPGATRVLLDQPLEALLGGRWSPYQWSSHWRLSPRVWLWLEEQGAAGVAPTAGAVGFDVRPSLSARLECTVPEYDPAAPDGRLRLWVKNERGVAVDAPVTFDGRGVGLKGGSRPWPELTLRGMPAAWTSLAPGAERLLLDAPLEELLVERRRSPCHWTWRRRAHPGTPLIRARGGAIGFVAMAGAGDPYYLQALAELVLPVAAR